jgi:hypothetical protein
MPKLPQHWWELPAMFGAYVHAIDEDIYAMWELPPNSYVVQAFFTKQYFGIPSYQIQGRLPDTLAVWPELNCVAGEASFLVLTNRFSIFTVRPALKAISAEQGIALIKNSLRSAGVAVEGVGYRDCDGKW